MPGSFISRAGAALAVLAALVAGAAWALYSARGAPHETAFRVEELVVETRGGARHVFSVEIAQTPAEMRMGLMFRASMPPDHGMLFKMGEPARPASFWMKNTLIPLDIIFIARDGEIIRIARNRVPGSLSSVHSGGSVTGVLEINGGRADALGISEGDRVVHPFFPQSP